MVLAFIKEFKLDVKTVSTGSPPATLTNVMSGQVDIGWASPPFGLKEMDEGKINWSRAAALRRSCAGKPSASSSRTDAEQTQGVIRRYMQAYRERSTTCTRTIRRC